MKVFITFGADRIFYWHCGFGGAVISSHNFTTRAEAVRHCRRWFKKWMPGQQIETVNE